MTSAPPLNVFISYAKKDEDLKEELEVHLSTLTRQKKINPWHNGVLEGGEDRDAEIKAQLEAAHIILLLITPRFIASDYLNDVELQHAMERHEQKTARVIPVILKPTDLEGTEFSRLQALPKDAKPVTKWADQDEAFLDVVKGIRRAVESLAASLPDSGSSASMGPVSKLTSSMSTQAVSPLADDVQKRINLIQLLSGLPEPQFNTIVTALKPPAGIFPSTSAPQGDRVSALLNWAEGPTGCQLDTVVAVVNQFIKNP